MTVTKTFGYTGGWQTYTIPAGITSVLFNCNGGGSSGANGARTTGGFPVSPGDVIAICVGGGGHSHSGESGGAGSFPGGGAGGPGNGASGGNSGAGYSCIRWDSPSGAVITIAGGSGGTSGDGGAAGDGGGGNGGRGNAGGNSTTASTHGSGGNGGTGATSSSGSEFHGGAGADWTPGNGGGGGSTSYNGPGGGGGGGGYGGGGGGCAGSAGYSPGVGGAGGGSYINGGVSNPVHTVGGGAVGNGNIIIQHADPNSAPNVPVINAPAIGARTLSTGTVAFSAHVTDPDGDNVRALFRFSITSNFSTYVDLYSGFVASGGTATASSSGFLTNSRYYVRCYAQDTSGAFSSTYDTTNFYTNYDPAVPTSVVPANGTRTRASTTLAVSAHVSDPDGTTVRALFRVSKDNFNTYTDTYSSYVASGSTATATLTGLIPNTTYQMYVYGEDPQGQFSDPTAAITFYTNYAPTAPTLVSPANNSNIDNTQSLTMKWTFTDPDTAVGDSQTNADIRYRAVGDSTWINNSTSPGSTASFIWPANTFTTDISYEWQVRTYDQGGLVGPYSASRIFTGGPPSIHIAAGASMTIAAQKTINSTIEAMAGKGSLLSLSSGKLTSGLLQMPAHAALIPPAMAVLTDSSAMNTLGLMQFFSTHSLIYPINIQTTTSMMLSGTKALTSSLLTMQALASLAIKVTLGIPNLQAQVNMLIDPGSSSVRSTVAMTVAARLASIGRLTESRGVPMAGSALLTSAGRQTHGFSLSMVAHGAVVDSGALSRLLGLPLSTKARLGLGGFSALSAPLSLSAVARLFEIGQIRQNEAVLALVANSGLILTGGPDTVLIDLPLNVVGALNIDAIAHNRIKSDLHILTFARMDFKEGQVVFEGPYLVVPTDDATMSFTASSFPNPRGVRNNPSVGVVIPYQHATLTGEGVETSRLLLTIGLL